MRTLRPLGPNVELTARANVSTPFSREVRASTPNLISYIERKDQQEGIRELPRRLTSTLQVESFTDLMGISLLLDVDAGYCRS